MSSSSKAAALLSLLSTGGHEEVELDLRSLAANDTTVKGHYLPEAFEDNLLQHLLAQNGRGGKVQVPACPTVEQLSSSDCHGSSARPPTLLLLHMPWFTKKTGHLRAWTLLYVLQYRCLMSALNMRMVVMVQPGELAGCQRICRVEGRPCRCHESKHHREHQQRNIAEFAHGREHILYAHADVFLNLPLWSRLTAELGNETISPGEGLDGVNYRPTPSACVPANEAALNASKRWWWHLDARPKCLRGATSVSAAALGSAERAAKWSTSPMCCYGWADVAYLPMAGQHAFRRMTKHSFWDVQVLVPGPGLEPHPLSLTRVKA
jgi:hypothetical protein